MESKTLDLSQIEEILPQRYPFLLIDKVLDYKENDYLIAEKNITGNEWACEGGCCSLQYFPGVLIIEAAAQAAILLYHLTKVKNSQKPLYFLGKVETEFLRQVKIGDQISMKAQGGKMMATGGYTDISVKASRENVCDIRIFYSALKE